MPRCLSNSLFVRENISRKTQRLRSPWSVVTDTSLTSFSCVSRSFTFRSISFESCGFKLRELLGKHIDSQLSSLFCAVPVSLYFLHLQVASPPKSFSKNVRNTTIIIHCDIRISSIWFWGLKKFLISVINKRRAALQKLWWHFDLFWPHEKLPINWKK